MPDSADEVTSILPPWEDLRVNFDSRPKLKFLGSQVTTDAGLLEWRPLRPGTGSWLNPYGKCRLMETKRVFAVAVAISLGLCWQLKPG